MSKKKLTASRVRLKKILRKNKYGLELLINEYAKIIQEVYNDEYINSLTSQILSEVNLTESLSDDFFSKLSDKINSIILKVSDILERAWNRGSDKVLDISAVTLNLQKPEYKTVLQVLVQQQFEYIKNIDNQTKEIIRDEIKNGIIKGTSYDEMAKQISARATELTEERSKLIAQTELVRVTSQAQEQTLAQNGIEKYIYLTAEDKRVSKICWKNSKTKGDINDPYNIYEVGKGPLPVRDSHPRCRCVIVKAPDD